MTKRLVDRVAFINGGARGIGRASALRLAGEGARVWITSRDTAAMDEALAEARAQGLSLTPLEMDSSQSKAIRQAISHGHHTEGDVDDAVARKREDQLECNGGAQRPADSTCSGDRAQASFG